MRTVYGFDDLWQSESVIETAEAMMVGFDEANKPERYLVNVFPWLRYIPKWLPGGRYKVYFEEVAALGREVVNTPFEQSIKNIVSRNRRLYLSSLIPPS